MECLHCAPVRFDIGHRQRSDAADILDRSKPFAVLIQSTTLYIMSRLYTLVFVYNRPSGSATIREHVDRILTAITRSRQDITFNLEEETVEPRRKGVGSTSSLEPDHHNSLRGDTAYLLVGEAPSSDRSECTPSEDQTLGTSVIQNSDTDHPSPFARREPIRNSSSELDHSDLLHTCISSWSVRLLHNIHLLLSRDFELLAEAEALQHAMSKTFASISYAGSNILPVSAGGTHSEEEFLEAVVHHFDFYLEAAESQRLTQSASSVVSNITTHPNRPMGIIEKILTNSAVGLTHPQVSPGQMTCVGVEWVLTSELLWAGMEKTYNQMKRPRPHRNDRIWLAVDHTVDPRTKHLPKQQELMAKSERFRDEVKIINYLPANTSIMHTDFTREKAQPGTIVIGSDSHTCSAGSMGALAVGFGAADVVMPLVTGETWFRVPEVCRINFTGSLHYGITGKDVILHILGLFKRNTIAFQRAVEYGGPSLSQLSMDARFAIANMTTEFGGMGACFEADEVTAKWISARRRPGDRVGGQYFRADPDAVYVEVRTIDLSQVELTMALYPNPDDVVPISAKSNMQLDGCFIGACTTTEEELVLAALVLEAGLRSGHLPIRRGKRVVTPGSLIIVDGLQSRGLLEIYREAGFEINEPSCSYCVGINDVDVAQPGEVWLSSQNRNFKNRMGKDSIGNITCAAAVAASSFDMKVTNPRELLDKIDPIRYKKLLRPRKSTEPAMPLIETPKPRISPSSALSSHQASSTRVRAAGPRTVTSRIQRFGTNVDTDAIIPAEFMPGIDNADLGGHCFEYFRPDFREKAAAGARIVVAEHGFGSGSSREDAVRALLGAGVECVVAKGFAFICKSRHDSYSVTKS